MISDGRNEVVISAASIWEAAIKAAKGRLDLPADLDGYVTDRLRRYRWTTLSIEARHAIRAATLPKIDADPFDRILVARSQLEAIPLIATDPAISRYDVETLW